MRLILYDRLTALFQMTVVRVAACLILFIQISACSLLTEKVYFGQYEQAEIEREAGFKDYKKQNYNAALKHYQNALAYLPSDAGAFRADLFYKIGRTNLKQQNYHLAIETFEQALQIQEKGGDRDKAILHNMLGLTYQKVSSIERAREHLNKALDLRYKSQDALGEARTLGNLAATYLSQGRYIKAIEYYKKTQQLFSSVSNARPKDFGSILTNLSSVYAEMGQYDKALSYQQQALDIYEKADDQVGIASAYHNIGYIKSEQLNYPAAVNAFEKAIMLREKIQDRFGVAETRNNLGMLLSDMGQHEKALSVLLKALPILRELNTRIQIAATYDSIGSVYARTGEFLSALEAYQKALLIWRETGDRESLRITLGNIGDVFTQSDRHILAIVFYKQAVNISEAIREELQVLPEQEQKAYLNKVEEFYRSLADLLLQQDRVIEAQQVLDLLKIQEAANYLGPVRGNTNTANGISTLSSEQEIEKRYMALQQEAIRVGKELAELRKTENSARSEGQDSKFQLLFAQEQQLQRAFVNFTESDEIRGLVDRLSREVRTQTPALEQLRPLRDNLKRIGEHVVLLYPLVLEDRLEIVLATGLSPPVHVSVPIDHKALNQTVLDFRTALVNRQDNVQESAQILYRWLIEPVAHLLDEIGADTILYAPDGVLRYVPLAALYDGDQWLAQRFKINNITAFSLTDLDTEPVNEPKLLAAAFASGNFSFSIGEQNFAFKGLPYAGQEVNNLALLYPDMMKLLDQDFNPAAVVPELNSFNIVHFATHAALVSGRAYESFILFGNGERVTVDQVKYDWTLTNVDLIVLSACETALGAVIGKGEEILGLGFLMESAGARATLASLWSVDDGGTQRLMNEFYSILKLPGVTKVEALQKAQIAMFEETRDSTDDGHRGVQLDNRDAVIPSLDSYRHPYYWAPFILIGNGL